ncbi:BTAD domain-containing putative transcriptional regulator [Pseudomonadota bacterium]
MTKLILELLGVPRISTSDTPDLRLSTKKSQALLIYLASPPGVARSRDQLADLLWGRSAQEQARSSLRQNLARLRKALGGANEAILANAQQIKLDPERVEIDTMRLESLLLGSDVTELADAAKLIRGEFASGLHINEESFDEWIISERRRISELAISALTRLLSHYEEQKDSDNAAAIACKLLAFDPLQEGVHRSLMRSLAHQERYESALQQYKQCRDLLKKELGINPGDDTTALHEEIARSRETHRHTRYAPAVKTEGLFRTLATKRPQATPIAPDLPPQLQGLNLSLPERPSIVILPFDNLTGDAENQHLAEGIRIDIQSALVKITGIFLIAAGSANAMCGRDAVSAGKALSVRYVLKGSVRRSGSLLRISAELIEVQSGRAIWTDSYDRQFDDGFDVQDEIIREIITSLDVKLLRGEQAVVWHRTLKNRDALECFYKGVEEFFKLSKEPMLRARKYFEAVDKKEPNVSVGMTWVAMCHWFDAFKAWGDDPANSLDQAGEWSHKAIQMEDADGQAHMVLSHVHLMNRQFDDALIVGRSAIQLRPNCTNANGFYANVLHYCGEQTDAIEHIMWAIRYSPIYPPFFADVLAMSFLFDRSFDAAIAVARESLRLNPSGITSQLVLIAGFNERGQVAEAAKAGAAVLASDPAFTIRQFAERQPYKNKADLKNFVAMLNSAGLPT